MSNRSHPRYTSKDLLQPTKALPLLAPTRSQWPILWEMTARLADYGYTEAEISKAMGVADHCERNVRAWPAHVRSCHKLDTPCARLAAFFLTEESQEADKLTLLLGPEILELLLDLLWVVPDQQGKLVFRYLLYPLLGTMILTDGFQSNPNHFDQVYQLGGDSHALARLTPRANNRLALDHCTGSGVHAVLASLHSEQSFGLDINPRALDFARLNAGMNKTRTTGFIESNCYQNVRAELLGLEAEPKFDLITANPPFIPTPEAIAFFRGGGASGEEITKKIIEGLPDKLSDQGIFSMITNIPIIEGQSFFERLDSWLQSSHSWAIIVLNSRHISSEDYIRLHITPKSPNEYDEDFRLWLKSYEAKNIKEMTNSQVYIFRCSTPWRIQREHQAPRQDHAKFIENWINAIRSYGSNTYYKLHPGIAKATFLEAGRRLFIEWKPEFKWWEPDGLWLTGEAATAFAQLEASRDGLSNNEVNVNLLLPHNLVLAKAV